MDAQVITTLAGGDNCYNGPCPGFADGTGSLAKFNRPAGIVSDSYGNIYVADSGNNRIRAITSSGVVTTIAGSATRGNATTMDDGNGWGAKFWEPTAMCKDLTGNIYVVDANGQRIRKITNQTVTTVATDDNRMASSAQGICLNASNFYIANLNNTISILSDGGNFSYILAGNGYPDNVDGTGTAARFKEPEGICQDASGNNYVADTQNHTIRKVTASGAVTTFAGSTQGYIDAIGISAKFFNPKGICIDPAGNLYVADSRNNKIRKITPNGIVTTVATLGIQPNHLCLDKSGNLYVTCTYNNTIIKITMNNLVVNDYPVINNLKVYPNLAKDHITLDFGTLADVVGYTVKVTNILGQELFNKPVNEQQYNIPLNSSSGQGMCFVKVINGQGHTIAVRKIILQ